MAEDNETTEQPSETMILEWGTLFLFEHYFFEQNKYSNQRYGQAFCNVFNLPPALKQYAESMNLFYEESTRLARKIAFDICRMV